MFTNLDLLSYQVFKDKIYNLKFYLYYVENNLKAEKRNKLTKKITSFKLCF